MTHELIALSENQIQVLQSSIERLHSTQEWDELKETIVLEAVRLSSEGKGLFFVFDQSLKQLILQASIHVEKKEEKEITRICRELFKQTNDQQLNGLTYKNNNLYFFPFNIQKSFSGLFVILLPHLSKEQHHLLTIFMQTVPIVVENSRLYLRMQRKTKSLNFMNQLHGLVKQVSFKELLAQIVKNIGDVLSSEMAGIMLYDPALKRLILQAPAFGVWDQEIIEQYQVSFNEESNAMSVFLSGIPSITADANHDSRYNKRYLKVFDAKSIITVPLIVEEKRIGILHVINKDKIGFFTEEDFFILSEMSEQLGILIQAGLQTAANSETFDRRAQIEKYLVTQLIENLLSDEKVNVEEAKKVSRTLGISLSPIMNVLTVKFFKNNKWLTDIEIEHQEFVFNIIRRALRDCCVTHNKNGYIILFPHETGKDIFQTASRLQISLEKDINNKLANFQKDKIEIFIGIGESVEGIEQIVNSFKQAKQILKALPKNRSLGKVGYYPMCGSWTLLSHLSNSNELTVPFLHLYLKKINDKRDSDELKKTLEAYIKHNGLLKKAANDLYIHQNTLKYRIEKIQYITGLDLTDSETLFNLTLALRLEHFMIEG